MKKSFSLIALPLMLAASSGVAFGQATTLKDAAQKAVLNNPEVQARWHAFKAAGEEQDVARGNYFPRLDVSAGAGREWLRQPGLSDTNLNHPTASVTLNQMLFDGFATRSEVKRLGEARQVRFHELLDASENTALEAGRAYYDVMRYRRLVQLAEDNYAQHKLLFDQIQQRAQAGVGRRVDLEQAGGRLALAESNLITESANLHDVSARYQRIVGEVPPPQLADPELSKAAVPATSGDALKAAFKQSPALQASVANVRAAQWEAKGQRASFVPRLDLRARQDWERNRLGVPGNFTDQVVEVVLNYNLFRGGSDMARSRQFAERLNQAKDLRDKSCRDLRQTLAIAYNDTRRLTEQLRFLDQHQLAIEKVRDAYRKQFDIGQRTLLDLLDTENELFQARRAYAIAFHDLGIAYARAHGAIGDLLSTLGLSRLDAQVEEDAEADPAAGDISSVCPPQAPIPVVTDKPAVAAQAAAANPPARAAAAAQAAALGGDEEALRRAVSSWAAAWSARDAATYAAFYAPDFVPRGGASRERWAAQRRQRLAQPGSIKVTAEEVAVRLTGPDTATTTFRQSYESARLRQVTAKTLAWKRMDGKWLIQSESAR